MALGCPTTALDFVWGAPLGTVVGTNEAAGTIEGQGDSAHDAGNAGHGLCAEMKATNLPLATAKRLPQEHAFSSIILDSGQSRSQEVSVIVSEQADPAVQHTAFYAQYRTHDSMELLSV